MKEELSDKKLKKVNGGDYPLPHGNRCPLCNGFLTSFTQKTPGGDINLIVCTSNDCSYEIEYSDIWQK